MELWSFFARSRSLNAIEVVNVLVDDDGDMVYCVSLNKRIL